MMNVPIYKKTYTHTDGSNLLDPAYYGDMVLFQWS